MVRLRLVHRRVVCRVGQLLRLLLRFVGCMGAAVAGLEDVRDGRFRGGAGLFAEIVGGRLRGRVGGLRLLLLLELEGYGAIALGRIRGGIWEFVVRYANKSGTFQ